MVQCQLYDISGFEGLEILKVCMEYIRFKTHRKVRLLQLGATVLRAGREYAGMIPL